MANINITISYNPSAATGSQWSLTATGTTVVGTTIEINDQGDNPIRWAIGMASGAVRHHQLQHHDDAPGIHFTGLMDGRPGNRQ